MLSAFPAAIVENIRLNSDGYSPRGTYYGRGLRVYRLADGETGLDFTVRAATRKQASALLFRAISTAYENHAFWTRKLDGATQADVDALAWKLATRDTIALVVGASR